MNRVIKCLGHCYDGTGWFLCDFWAGHLTHIGANPEGNSRCLLFGGAEKYASEALLICNKVYGSNYEGKP
jgi:hypothetical protein